MYVVIAGCRKVGSNLAVRLSQENHDVAVISSDPEDFELLGSGFNGLTVTGTPIDEDVLRSAGIERADALAAVSNDDNINMMISQVAINIFHVPKVITRVYDPERDAVYKEMGIMTICPTTLAVNRIEDFLTSVEKNENHVIAGKNIAYKYVRPSKFMIGKTIGKLEGGHIFGIIHEDKFLLADPKLHVGADDMIVLAEYAE